MNKLETLAATRDQWQWLADNPDKDKADYFTKDNVAGYRPAFYCYCCQFVLKSIGHNKRGMNCSDRNSFGFDQAWLDTCPLKTLWPDGCESPSSVYIRWRSIWIIEDEDSPEERADKLKLKKIYAQQIADHCQKLIDEEGPQAP